LAGRVNLLAIETATDACAVGLRGAERELALVADGRRRHSEALVASIHALLDECGLAPRDLERIVVDRGPGLFTGLRVGVATAISLAQALGAELVGVTSLELLARGALDGGVRGGLVAAVDGRRGELFVQRFELGDGVRALDEPVALSVEAVTRRVSSNGDVTVTGDGVVRYREAFAAAGAPRYEQTVPSLHAALALGASREPQARVTPLYLRDADAVANFATRSRA
jgi:tRNA threonylcarbamoyladenosine biosynthesis protein TsaB